MNRIRPHKLSLGVLAGLLLSACQAQAPQGGGDKPLDVQTLYIAASCGTAQATLQVVPDAAALARAVKPSNTLGGEPPKAAAVDFSQRAVYQLSMGQQPSAGAGVGVTSAGVDGTGSRLTVQTLWQLPEPGRMYAAVVTQPCVVFSVPRGAYRTVRVVDQQGQQKLAVDLPR